LINHTEPTFPALEKETQMSMFRVHLAAGEKSLKADLRALDEDSARSAAAKWFDRERWEIVEIKRLAT
jgi:hypothetical protein